VKSCKSQFYRVKAIVRAYGYETMKQRKG